MTPTTPITLTIRGYKSGKLLWTKKAVFLEKDIERILPTLAEEHSAAMAAGTLGMVEIEFMDEPDPQTRFFRIGVEAEGMVMPVVLALDDEEIV